MYIPVEAIGDTNSVRALVQELTHVPHKSFVPAGAVIEPIKMYDPSRFKDEGYLGVPRAFGMRRWGNALVIEDHTVEGLAITTPKRPDPNHPRVRNPAQQREFMDNLHGGIVNLRNFLATAPTGSGKTVCFLDAAARHGRTTVILCHLERLMHQWAEEIRDKLGVAENEIAIIQQDNVSWTGKKFAVGLLHSIVRRDYPRQFWEHWGVACVDEVHKVGSNFFAPAIVKFPARVRVGLSATMERKDRGDKVFIWHIGPVAVRSKAEALPIKVYVKRFTSRMPLWGDDMMTRVKCLTKDKTRNRMIAYQVSQAFQRGRQGLVVGASVEHLQEIMRITHEEYKVPNRAMGRFFGELHLGKTKVTDAYGQKVPKVLKKKRTAAELDAVKQHAQIIFATYGMMTEGIDIPRLDWGIDATPSGKATQVIGRIRRPFDGKPEPIWVTVVDENCAFSQKMFKARCREYLSSGATVIDNGG